MEKEIKNVINKEFHTYYDDYPKENCLHSLVETEMAIINQIEIIHTTYTNSMILELIEEDGYRIFWHYNKECFEAKIGDDNEWTEKQIRLAHNINRMITSSILFDLKSKNYKIKHYERKRR